MGPRNNVRAYMTATQRTSGGARLPLGPATRRADWHTHQNPALGQGPSYIDSLNVVRFYKMPHIIESIDSLFLIEPRGSGADITGCAK